jgi:hypothetical protein
MKAIELLKRFGRWLLCKTNNHCWTCAVEQGQDKPTPEQVAAGVEGFFDYAKMYCKYCGYVWPGSWPK